MILAGKRGSHHHSTMSFSVNVVVAETSYRMLEVLSFCDGKRIKITVLIFLVNQKYNEAFWSIYFLDHFTFLGNYPPTPPLSQHFALSEK